MHTQSQSFRDLVEAGMKYSASHPFSEPEPELVESPPNSHADFLAAMVEAGQIYSNNGNIKHDKQDYEKWSQEKKVANCSRRVANFGIRKGYNGLVERTPRYCNHCAECYEANTLKLKNKVEAIAEKVLENDPGGQWRKKVVEPDKEAKSLKKRIKRNQEGRHIEIACTDNSGKTEVWTYTKDEPGKDDLAMNDAYGEPANLDEIEFDALYRKNRSTGKKMSTGAAFRKSGAGVKKEGTERVMLPDIIVKDTARIEEAEKIIQNTNFIKEAKSAEEAKRLYAYQFKFILEALKKANIEIAAIKMNFFNIAKEQLLNDWNMNVKYWMSIDAPLLKDSGRKIDTSYLVYPKSSEISDEPVAN
jgi:hypothetical protein